MSATSQLKKEILEAYIFLREKNNTIPNSTLEFIRDAAIEKVKQFEYKYQIKEEEKNES